METPPGYLTTQSTVAKVAPLAGREVDHKKGQFWIMWA